MAYRNVARRNTELFLYIMAGMQSIVWPTSIDCSRYTVHSYNCLFINATKEKIWQSLIDAKKWPEWYPNSKNIRIQDSQILKAGSEFVWKTFGLTVHSKVIEYKEFESIGWTAYELGGEGYHGWRLIEQDGGTLVVTEEVQRGWGAVLLAPLIKRGLQKQHQIWLEGLKIKVE